MSQNNQRLAAIAMTLIAIMGTLALTIFGVPVELATSAIAIQGTVGGLKALQTR